jgi:hypothetical protein
MTNQVPSTTEIIFFQAQTTNGSSTGMSFIFPMKRACLKYWGTWDGATVTFQTATPLDSSYWIPIDTLNGTIASFTSDGQSTLELVVYGDLLRCTISGGGGSMSLNVTAQAV